MRGDAFELCADGGLQDLAEQWFTQSEVTDIEYAITRLEEKPEDDPAKNEPKAFVILWCMTVGTARDRKHAADVVRWALCSLRDELKYTN